MKNNFLKIALVAVGLVAGTVACIKHDPPVKPPVGGSDGGNNNPCMCYGLAEGTIEMCPGDQNLWFINATYFPLSSFAPMPAKLFVPGNLPPAFKVNGLTVNFEYNELSDSVQLLCWRCGTPPPPYAKKITLCTITEDSDVVMVKKPNIYLYPTKETRVEVKLDYKGRLTATYPDYNKALGGWSVIAKPDGTLKNTADKLEYQYLFWEGTPAVPYNFNMSDGFCIKGSETKAFLQNILPKLGLIPKEYNEMIVFWLPQMMKNPYNLIHFAADDYTKTAPLSITPKPDNLIRVFMAYQPSQVYVKTNEPLVVSPKRSGFTVVEWGGAEIPLNLNTLRNHDL